MQSTIAKLTSFENSPILNGVKTIGSAAQYKAGKALMAATITTSAIALSTGVVPAQFNIAGQQISNIEEAQAGFVADAINKVGARNLWYYLNGGRFKQVWFRTLDRNTTSWYNRQYNAAAQPLP